ncbi:MAG: hypothetical protein DDT23_01176 [candidate division WS2 bacterium]|nr:hypothetical protein [Candidatus Lithacetigena glycinireducens]
MKKKVFILLVLLVSLVGFSTNAFAANQENYDISIPPFRDAWSHNYLLNNGRLFETRLAASGGQDIAMQISRADTRAALGPTVIVSPSTTRTALWRNNTGINRWVVVRLNSVLWTYVTVRAQGTWFWNHL